MLWQRWRRSTGRWSQGCLSCRKTSTNWPTRGHHRADRRRSLIMWLWCTAGDVDGEARQGDQSAVSAAGRRRQTTITQRHSLQQLRQEHRRGRYTCIEASHTGCVMVLSDFIGELRKVHRAWLRRLGAQASCDWLSAICTVCMSASASRCFNRLVGQPVLQKTWISTPWTSAGRCRPHRAVSWVKLCTQSQH